MPTERQIGVARVLVRTRHKESVTVSKADRQRCLRIALRKLPVAQALATIPVGSAVRQDLRVRVAQCGWWLVVSRGRWCWPFVIRRESEPAGRHSSQRRTNDERLLSVLLDDPLLVQPQDPVLRADLLQ